MNPSLAHPELKREIALQGVAVVIVGAVFILFWNDQKKTAVSHLPTSSADRISSAVPNLLSDLNLILILSLLAVLFGVACAFYLEERLSATSWVRRFIESQVAFLTEIPSLFYGLFAIAILFKVPGVFKGVGAPPSIQNVPESGVAVAVFQWDTLMFSAEVLIFILLVMPIAIKTTQEALRSVATPIREAAYVLGANQWQVLTKQVVPLAFPRMLAGGCRALSRALSAAALLIGIHLPNHTTGPRGIPDRFMLFLGGALLLSTISSVLKESGLETPTTATARHD